MLTVSGLQLTMIEFESFVTAHTVQSGRGGLSTFLQVYGMIIGPMLGQGVGLLPGEDIEKRGV